MIRGGEGIYTPTVLRPWAGGVTERFTATSSAGGTLNILKLIPKSLIAQLQPICTASFNIQLFLKLLVLIAKILEFCLH